MTAGRSRAGRLAALLLAGALATPVAAVAAPGQTAVGAVHATITQLGQSLTRDPSSTLHVNAIIVNDSVAPVTRIRWRLRVGPRVMSRVGLTTPFDERGDSTVIWHDDELVVDELAAGERHYVSLTLPLAELENFDPPDVPSIYPLRLEVTHRLVNQVASADTFLLWYPQAQPTVRVGWIVPVTEPPARTAGFAIRGDSLEQSVSPGGRLDGVLTALDRAAALAGEGGLPVTLAIDAETVESISALAAGSARVAADGTGPPTQRIGSAAAAAWLARLRQLAASHPVIALPYADADVVALVRAGPPGLADLTTALGRARAGPPGLDGPNLDALLGTATIGDIAWPVGEVADSATTNALADNGVHAIVLDRTSLRTVIDVGYTTTAASDIDTAAGRITAIVPDAPLTSLADDMVAAGSSGAVATQRLLAETAALQQERPDVRDVFVRFPRDWTPGDLDATAALLALPATTPWLTGTTVPEAVSRTARADNRVRTPRYPPAAHAAELPVAGLIAAHKLRTELEAFHTILADSERPPAGTSAEDRRRVELAALDIRTRLYHARDALSWSESAHWRGAIATAGSLRTSVDGDLRGLRGQVFVDTNAVRLTSTSGPVPITVHNRLGTPVRVRLSLQSQRLGLTFEPVREITVPAARAGQPGSQSVQVPAHAQTIGKFVVDAQLRTADDIALGEPARITVSTTAYGRVALLTTAGAFVLLVLATLTRFVFRRRRDGRPGPADDPEPPSGADDSPPEAMAALPPVPAVADA